jgi:hypothetical protein
MSDNIHFEAENLMQFLMGRKNTLISILKLKVSSSEKSSSFPL